MAQSLAAIKQFAQPGSPCGCEIAFEEINMMTKRIFVGLLIAIAVLVPFATSVVGSGAMNLFSQGSKIAPIVPPQLIPPEETGYVTRQPGSSVTAYDGRPVAQFAMTPADLSQTFAVRVPEIRSIDPQIPEYLNGISYTILATLRYTGNGHTVLVTTARPSAAAAQKETYIGDLVTLSNGSMAWVRTRVPGKFPNQVILVHDDLIITIAGDFPINVLQELATQVVLK